MTVRKEKPEISMLAALRRLFPMVFRLYPGLFLLDAVLGVVHSLFWGISTLFTQRFFDEATRFVQGAASFGSTLLALAALGGVTIGCQALNGIANFMPQVHGEKVNGKLREAVHAKMARLPARCFEDTGTLDDINKANQGASNAFWFIGIVDMIFLFYLPYFLVMGWYLFTLKPILALSIIIIFIPTALTQLLRAKVFARLEDEAAPLRREYEYYEKCLTGREYLKETRLLGGYRFFSRLYREARENLSDLTWKARRRTGMAELGMKVLTLGGYLLILWMLFDALLKGEISAGAFAAVFSSLGLMFGIMEEIVCRHMSSVSESFGAVGNYLRFLDLPEIPGEEKEIPADAPVILEHVTFSYPGAKKPAVEDVSLTIRPGETVAIVGENGSGKSTLVRLITGLYDPDSGTVRYGEQALRELSAQSLFGHASGVFQKYQRYQMTLGENIGISETGREAAREKLDEVCQMAGFDAEGRSLPEGYDTILSREFDGVDLSGGQWQRVAIARGLFREHDRIVLDEPTAAIDPVEETAVYNRFAELSRNKTAVIVTHRLGSVKLADRIVVLAEGKIADIGTHEQLCAQGGVYAKMWEAQAQYYV
ncbi:MAG: ABC transporter ATP-binding protein [Candidatus Merdivicinus sp.]